MVGKSADKVSVANFKKRQVGRGRKFLYQRCEITCSSLLMVRTLSPFLSLRPKAMDSGLWLMLRCSGEKVLAEKHLGARGSDATCFSDLCNLDTVYYLSY